jgi:uncharacterized membrane protein
MTMSELVVVGFGNPYDADRALTELRRMQTELVVELDDAVVAVCPAEGKLQLKQSINLVDAGAASGILYGGVFGSLIGLLLLNPLVGFAAGGLGALVGGGSGALFGSLADYGIQDDFIRSLAGALKPDTSALFVLMHTAQPEKVLNEFSRFKGEVLRTSLSPEQEARLQKALSGAASTSAREQHDSQGRA